MKLKDLEKLQADTIKHILLNVEKKYLTDENVCRILLNGNKDQRQYLDLIDITHKNLITSIKFKQYRRAQRFLIALSSLCRKCFN